MIYLIIWLIEILWMLLIGSSIALAKRRFSTPGASGVEPSDEEAAAFQDRYDRSIHRKIDVAFFAYHIIPMAIAVALAEGKVWAGMHAIAVYQGLLLAGLAWLLTR